jgi:NAD(P)H-dependent flavin oxidoreductase YrpB (nitropropane dioxygenase family)
VDILCEEKPKLFVSAVGVAPKWVVDRLHEAGIICANMVGSPKHVKAALANGVDMIIAQGHEGGGHTGEIATSVLIPQVVDACRGKKNFFGGDVVVVAAGGIYDGRGLAAALTFGASGVWVGTAFITAKESGATPMHQKMVIEHNSWDTIRTSAMTGRPCRMIKTDYISEWEYGSRRAEREELEAKGIVAYAHDVHSTRKRGEHFDVARTYPQFAGQCIGGIKSVRPAKDIIEDMMTGACTVLTENAQRIVHQANL